MPDETTNIVVATTLLTSSILGGYTFYNRYLRRFTKPAEIPLSAFRKRFLTGRVTSVGDGDNFHFFHTPGGIFAGWGTLRPLPPTRTGLKTLRIRLCGVDAPECAHFGKPAQPYSAEALAWLRQYILGKKVKVKPLSCDQYGRVVSRVEVLTWLGYKNVSLEMIKAGLGVVYEGKTGGEFDGMERKFKREEERARVKRLGMWQLKKFETPGEYKRRTSGGTRD